jgi:leucyl-tRNA synthetase
LTGHAKSALVIHNITIGPSGPLKKCSIVSIVKKNKRPDPIEKLIHHFSEKGTEGIHTAQSTELSFTAEEWNSWDNRKKQNILMNYRIAYLGETMVNWCAGLGTVLANDEVVNGVSVRGGYPVVQKKMRQWCLRVSAYAQRLLDGLDTIDWSDFDQGDPAELDRSFRRN